MIKKKLSILLSLSLVALFTSLLSTTSYAKTLTAEEIRNFIYNSIEFRKSREPTEEEISAIESLNFSTWISASETYEGRWWIAKTSSDAVVFGYYTGTSSNLSLYCPYVYNDSIYANTSYLTRKKSATNSSYTTVASFSNDNTPIASSNNRFLYTDCNLYNGGTISTSTIVYPAGYSTIDNIFSYGESDYFTFLLSPSIPTITINGDSVPYFNLNSNTANDFYLGVLGLAENYFDSELFEYRYYQGKWKLNKITKIQDIGEVEQNLISVTIKGKYLASNTLYSLQMNPHPDSDFAPYSQPFFMKDRHTSITNGALDLDNTFSGDYYNNYNNDTNTQDIIDNLNDNAQVDSIVNNELSGDINDFANKLNYSPIANPFLSVIEFVLNGVCTTLLGSGSQTLTFTMHGRSYIISSDDIVLPNGIFATFISGMLVAFYLYAFYKYGFKLYEKIQSGEFTSVIKNISNSNDNDEMRRL